MPKKIKFEIQMKPISDLYPDPDNPREITDLQFAKLKQSLIDFPEMLHLRPIIYRGDGKIAGGNMRYRACLELGYKEIPSIDASGLTDDQIREFIIKDNLPFGKWDYDELANTWDHVELKAWGMEIFDKDLDLSKFFEEDPNPEDPKPKMGILVFEFTPEIHAQVKERLDEMDITKEQFLMKALDL